MDELLDNTQYIEFNDIKHFTLEDYFSCDETRNYILDEWDEEFNYYIADQVRSIYNYHTNYLKKFYSNTMYKATEEHVDDLLDIIKHHIKKEYSISMFEECPDLAEPLIKRKNEEKRNIDKPKSPQELLYDLFNQIQI